MKKYNKPEIVTLALDVVDVIETSGVEKAADYLTNDKGITADKVTVIKQQVTAMEDTWSW